MTDTPKPGDIHGHPIVECSDVRHAASRVHNHDNPLSVSTTDDWDECYCPIQFVRPEPTPEPWAGHPIKWCEEHGSIADAHGDYCDVAAYSRDTCRLTAYQPWVDLLAERDAALQVMNEYRCGEQAERAYRRTLRAEDGRDEARKELAALRVLDGASAERAEAERDEARREAIEAREALARATRLVGFDEASQVMQGLHARFHTAHLSVGVDMIFEGIMRERGFRDE